MKAASERGSGVPDLASDAGQEWIGYSVGQVPQLEMVGQVPLLEIPAIKSWTSITAVSYHRGEGESIQRSDRHRVALTLDDIGPRLLQIEQGPTQQIPRTTPGRLTFIPAGLTTRSVLPAARLIQVTWDTDLYSSLLPELGAAESRFEHVMSLAQEIEGGFADRILVESLGTALCVRIAQRFVGHLPLPTTNKGLSPERLRRVRDFIEAHLDDDLSLTVLADIACLSPYHFSRSFKESAGVGPQRYVIQRRLERAKTLLRRSKEPLALIAQEAGFADQSHLTSIFRREMGVTPGRFRAALG